MRHPLFILLAGGIVLAHSLRASPAILNYTPRGHTHCSHRKSEPLNPVELQGRFRMLNRNIETSTPATTQLDQYIAWITEAVRIKKQLRKTADIDSWLDQLAENHAADWKMIIVIAAAHNSAATERHRCSAIKLMNRAYFLAIEQQLPPSDFDALAVNYCKVLLAAGQNSIVDLNKSYCNLSEDDLPAQHLVSRYDPAPPVFYKIPASYEAAENDGERIRWLISQISPEKRKRIMADFAVYTAGESCGMQSPKSETGFHALSELRDNQTVYWNRYTPRPVDLPSDYRFIDLYTQLARSGDTQSAKILGDIFMNRFQQDRAAEYYEVAGAQKQLQHILSKRGGFSATDPAPAGTRPKLNYLYRNGSKVTFSIHRMPAGKQFMARLKNGQVSHGEFNLFRGLPAWYEKMNEIEKIGHLIHRETVNLPPTTDHRNSTYTWEPEALMAGAYLVSANMENGTAHRMMLNVYDSILRNQGLSPDGIRTCKVQDQYGNAVPDQVVHIMQLVSGTYQNGRIPPPRWVNAIQLTTDENGQVFYRENGSLKANLACIDNGSAPALCDFNSSSSKPRTIRAGSCGGIGLHYSAVGLSPENTFY